MKRKAMRDLSVFFARKADFIFNRLEIVVCKRLKL